jgi:SAM-dependent methyltransferase
MSHSSDPAVVRLHTCPLCGSHELTSGAVPGRWIGEEVFGGYRGTLGLSACAGCGFEFVNPRPNDALLGEFYGGSDYTCHDPQRTDTAGKHTRHVLDFVGRHVEGRRILDFGCGAGVFLRHATDAGWQATGYDLGASAISNCRRQGLDATSDLGALPRGAFDAVVLNHVFEHVSDQVGTLATLHDLLAPEGRLFIECPNVRSLRARLSHPLLSRYANFDERYRAFPIHLSYFSQRTLGRLLETNRFEIEKSVSWAFGIEELLREPASAPRDAARDDGEPTSEARTSRLRSLMAPIKPVAKAILTRLILEPGLGENLMVVARRG